MDINLASIVKTGVIVAFIIPLFSLILVTLPTNPPPVLANNASSPVINNLTAEMNSTSLYIQRSFLATVTGLNSSLNDKNGSFSANPTIFTAFAFIINGFGTTLQTIVMVPYIDYISLHLIETGMSYALPPFIVNIIVLGIDLLYAYMILSVLLLGISMIEKYNAKT
jgi:hypothetical protein